MRESGADIIGLSGLQFLLVIELSGVQFGLKSSP